MNQNDLDNFNETKKEPTNEDQYVLSDIDQDPVTKEKQPEIEKILFQRQYRDFKGNVKTKTVKQVSANQKKGETVYTASDLAILFDFFVDPKK